MRCSANKGVCLHKRPWTFASEFFHKEIHRVLRSKGPAEVLTKVEKEGVLGLRDNMHFLMQMLTRFSTVYIAFCTGVFF
jgi:hypothetical protein